MRTEIFHCEKIVRPIEIENDIISLTSKGSYICKGMAERRFVSHSGSVEDFIFSQENRHTLQKTQRDVSLLESFLKTKNEERKIKEIPAVELNQYISQFIIAVRTKDGNQYEPASLRSLVASFERYLKRKNYPSSIINDLVFDQTMKSRSRSKNSSKNKVGEISQTLLRP